MWQKIDLPDDLREHGSPFEWLAFRIQRFSASLGRPAPGKSLESATESRPNLVSRLFGLRASEVALLIEAGAMLTFFRVALKFLSMQRLTAWMGNPNPAGPELKAQAKAMLRRVEWAIGAVVRHAPLSYVCSGR